MRMTKRTARVEKQITAPESEPTLTFKQEAFVNALLETGNQYEAYRRAYECENMSRGAIDVEACKLVRHPKIALRLGQLRESKTAEAMLTLEVHMEELKTLRDLAKNAGQLSAAISAEVKRGKLRRFYVKQIESAHVNEFSSMSEEELRRFIRFNSMSEEELRRFIRESDTLIRSMEPGVSPAVPHNRNGRSKR